MKAHKWGIICSLVVFLASSITIIYMQWQPESREVSLWQNIALGVWGSNLLVFVLENINYINAKDDLIFQFLNESQKIWNLLLQVRKQSGKTSVNLGELIMSLEVSLDFTHLFYIYSNISFFINWHKWNKCKANIDEIQKGLAEMHRNIVNFSALYPTAPNEYEQKIMIKRYCEQDEKILDAVLKHLETLKKLKIKNYKPIISLG